jgi:hypothetical protein
MINIISIEYYGSHLIVTYDYEKEPYRLCNKHLRTWRAHNSTED